MRDATLPNEHWTALRECWLNLQDPVPEHRYEISNDLRERHRNALTALMADRALLPDVAERVQQAFEEAITHIQGRAVMCYAVLPAAVAPREDLLAQTVALIEMAEQSDIAPATIAKAQDALARDIAWLAQFEAGGKPWQQEPIEVSPAEAEAARILADLLSGKM